jgi:hypothetical protein
MNQNNPNNIQTDDYFQTIQPIVDTVSELLEEIIKESESITADSLHSNELAQSELVAIFNSRKVPSITINKYLMRIVKYSHPAYASIITTLIYIDKLCESSNLILTRMNIHRLLLSCFVISIKFNEDDYYSNEYYAKVGGVSLCELNKLEETILSLLDFSLFIDDELYDNYEKQLSGDDNI